VGLRGSEQAFLLFLAAMAALRLGELWLAKRNLRSHDGRARPEPEPLYAWMVALHASFFILVPLELLLRRPDFGGWLSWTAIPATALALSLRFWTLRTLGRSWHVRVVHGDDYPIVDGGPYRWIRHPNYVVVALELAFIPLIHGLYWSALALSAANAAVLRRRIALEEAILSRNPEWRARMAPKPRFLPLAKARRPEEKQEGDEGITSGRSGP